MLIPMNQTLPGVPRSSFRYGFETGKPEIVEEVERNLGRVAQERAEQEQPLEPWQVACLREEHASTAKYERDLAFVEEVDGRDIQPTDHEHAIGPKRDLLSKRGHTWLYGRGGIHIPLTKCTPGRIGNAFEHEYQSARTTIDQQ